ncbi:MAG: hypothetical protein A2297_02845 [Elusimicrobia bacterium RIFOXYB2_FULL_48_7]|nr:MAG: hypothetical protein A2297_02845 [Elusimicrobia bacterium RIFOXYB2_FULL_48_7]
MYNRFIAVSCVFLSCFFVSAVFGADEVQFDPGAVFITLTRKPEPPKNLSTNVSLVNREKIDETHPSTTRDLLSDNVGITEVSKTGTLGSTSNLRIRSGGDTSKQVLVMIDGLPVNNLATGAADLSYISPDNIDRIEIVRGPASSLYGSNALNGVVNIISKQPKGKVMELGLETGSFNTNTLRAACGGKSGIVSWLLSGSNSVSDGWRENSDYYNTNFNADFKIDLRNAGVLSVNSNFFTDKVGVPGENFTGLANYDGIAERKATTPKARQEDINNYIQASQEFPLGGDSKLNAKVYSRSTRMNYLDMDNVTNDRNYTNNSGAGVQLDTARSVTLGADAQSQSYTKLNNLTGIEDINKTFSLSSLFAQKEFEFSKLRTTLGARYDSHSVYGSQLNPRLNNVYNLDDDMKLSLNIGRAFTGPTFEDIYSPVRTWDFFGYGGETRGNPALVPETSWGYDFGMEKHFNEETVSKVTVFRSDIQDKIEWKENYVPTPGYILYSVWQPENIGEAYNQGVEFEISSKLSEALTNEFNATALESKGRKKTETDYKTLMYSPQYRANYSVTYRSPRGVTERISASYTSEQKWTDDFATEHKIDPYVLVDFRFSGRISYTEWFLVIENLADVQYQSRENYPLPGRTLKGGVTIRY